MIRILAILLALAGPVSAQDDPASAALAAAEQLTRAGLALSDATGGRNRVAALTEAVKGYEDGLIAMRDGLRRVAIRQQTLEASLDAKSAEIGKLLGVLQSISRAPAPLLLLHPTGPTGTARSGMIVAEVTPALHAEADALKSATAGNRSVTGVAGNGGRDAIAGVTWRPECADGVEFSDPRTHGFAAAFCRGSRADRAFACEYRHVG